MYITLDEYNQITNRPITDATESRIRRASFLLDSRIGNYACAYDGWKLDLDNSDSVTEHQAKIVKEWVAFMIAFLVDNNDSAPSRGSVKLGRFSATEDGEASKVIPEALIYSDIILAGSGLIKRKVQLT
jgi:hypothetical protein